MHPVAKVLISLGIALIIGGLIFEFGPRVPGLHWLGRLPGDVMVRKPGYSVYFPWVSCLVISILLSLISRLFRG